MANFITQWWDDSITRFAQSVAQYIQDPLNARYGILANYYTGDHRPQLKRKDGQPDENIIQNFIGLAVDRSVSRLYRGGVKFVLPEGAEAQQEYIDKVWDLNKKEIILYQVGLHGADFGTCFFEVMPEQISDPIKGGNVYYPRLVALYPPVVRIITNPQDVEQVLEYRLEYKVVHEGKEIAYRKIVRRANDGEGIEQMDGSMLSSYWRVTFEVKEGAQQWQMVSDIPWLYDFPPIIHWKNLPSLNSVLGDSDIDDAINIQDKSNFTVSNTGKIIKYHASPTTIVSGVAADGIKPVDKSPNAMFAIPNPDAKVYNLELQSDLASSRAFYLDLQQSIFDIAREVNPSSISDKLGSLTNFAVRVMFNDALDKNDTKRQLYGDALKELNRRILVLAGYLGEQSDPGSIQWGEAMPTNVVEDIQADKALIDLRLVDRQTVYERYKSRFGLEWEEVKERLEEEKDEREENQERIFGNGAGPDQRSGADEGGQDNGEDEEGDERPVAERLGGRR